MDDSDFASLDRHYLMELQMSLARLYHVIKRKDEDWTELDILEELEESLKLLKKSGFELRDSDFSITRRRKGL